MTLYLDGQDVTGGAFWRDGQQLPFVWLDGSQIWAQAADPPADPPAASGPALIDAADVAPVRPDSTTLIADVPVPSTAREGDGFLLYLANDPRRLLVVRNRASDYGWQSALSDRSASPGFAALGRTLTASDVANGTVPVPFDRDLTYAGVTLLVRGVGSSGPVNEQADLRLDVGTSSQPPSAGAAADTLAVLTLAVDDTMSLTAYPPPGYSVVANSSERGASVAVMIGDAPAGTVTPGPLSWDVADESITLTQTLTTS